MLKAASLNGDAAAEPVYSTLLELVQSLQDAMDSETEICETVVGLVESGRVILTGNFKGSRLELA